MFDIDIHHHYNGAVNQFSKKTSKLFNSYSRPRQRDYKLALCDLDFALQFKANLQYSLSTLQMLQLKIGSDVL